MFSCPFSDPRASPQMGTDLDFFDMKLTAKQKQHVDKGDDVGVSDNALAASNKAFHKWPNAIIPYEIDCSLGMSICFPQI